MSAIKVNKWILFLALLGCGILAVNFLKKSTTTTAQAPDGRQLMNIRQGSLPANFPIQGPATNAQVTNQAENNRPLPNDLERFVLEIDTSKRNPFAAVVEAPMVKKIKTPAPVVQATVQPAPQPPMMPPLNLKFVGRLTETNGMRLVFASLNEAPVTLAVGQTLSNGFRVDAINDNAVEFTYIALNTTAKLDLPKPPIFEIR